MGGMKYTASTVSPLFPQLLQPLSCFLFPFLFPFLFMHSDPRLKRPCADSRFVEVECVGLVTGAKKPRDTLSQAAGAHLQFFLLNELLLGLATLTAAS